MSRSKTGAYSEFLNKAAVESAKAMASASEPRSIFVFAVEICNRAVMAVGALSEATAFFQRGLRVGLHRLRKSEVGVLESVYSIGHKKREEEK